MEAATPTAYAPQAPRPPNKERKLTTEFVRQDLAQNSSTAAEPDRVRVIREGVASYLPDIDPDETARMAGVVRRLAGAVGARPGPLPDVAAAGTRRRTAGRHPRADVDRLRQHHPDRAGAVVPRRRGRRAPLPRLDPVERRDHGAPRAAAGSRCGRPHFDVRVVGGALRGRLQPLLPRQGPPRRRRPDLHPGPRLPRHLRPRVPGGPANRRPARRLPPGAQPSRRRPPVLPAPAADARLLGVPDGVDGPGPDERHLSGPVQPLPARPRHQGHLRPARVGVPRRRRDGRAGEPRPDPGRAPTRGWTT